jgi:transposase InsO family protein
VGWGYYKLIPVEDDYSRKIIAYGIRPDETAFTLSDILELGIEEARREGHLVATMPKLYTDNGSGFTSKILTEYLSVYGMGSNISLALPIILRAEGRLNGSTEGSRKRYV